MQQASLQIISGPLLCGVASPICNKFGYLKLLQGRFRGDCLVPQVSPSKSLLSDIGRTQLVAIWLDRSLVGSNDYNNTHMLSHQFALTWPEVC